MTTTYQDLAARIRARAEIHRTMPIPSACDKITARELLEIAAALEAASQPPGAVGREADPLTQLIQRLNSSPYNLTKDECIEEAKALRAALSARSPAPEQAARGKAWQRWAESRKLQAREQARDMLGLASRSETRTIAGGAAQLHNIPKHTARTVDVSRLETLATAAEALARTARSLCNDLS